MKKGTTAITVSIMTVFCTTMFCVILIYAIECIIPFVLHQKLQSIATKYMYVIEKYGYLTNEERDGMLQELMSKGFEQDKVKIIYPKEKRSYGEILELKITYNYESKIQSIPMFGMDRKELIVSRVSYCKI